MLGLPVLAPTFLLLSILAGQARAANFTFAYGNPIQCENFTVSWTGGNPPFELTLVPNASIPITYSIPSSSYSNGKGVYGVQLPLNPATSFLATMSDMSGFGSGGVSEVLVTGASVSNAQCNTTLPANDFYFSTDDTLQQCSDYSFSDYTGADLPVTVIGLIPGGTSFALHSGANSLEWVTDVAEGTEIIFFMTDANGRQGGAAQIQQVEPSSNASCLTGTYPSSVAVHPSSTAISSTGTVSSTSSVSSTSTSSGSSSYSSSISGGFAAIIATLLALRA